MEWMDKYILHKRKALDRRTCEHLINIFKKSSPVLNDRDYWGLYPSLTDASFSFLKPILRKCMDEYGEKHPFMGMRINEWKIDDKFHIQKYEKGHFYDSYRDPAKILGHMEHGWSEYDCRRVLAWMVYLNDIKKDGGTCWPQQKFTSKPRAGDLYIWPSAWTHSHYGIPAPNEEKYILTGWCSFSMDPIGLL